MHEEPEKKLRMCEQNFREFFESIQDWVWEMDLEGVHTYSNSAVEDILGYEVDEIVGSSAWEFWPEEDKEKIDKDEFKETLKEGEGWDNFKGKFQHKDGSLKYLESTAVPIYDEDDDLIGYRGVDRDITDRIEMEEREEFLHSLLRHDVSNKMQIINGYLELMDEEDLPDKVEDWVSNARKASQNAREIVGKVKTLRKLSDMNEDKEIELYPRLDEIVETYKNNFDGKNLILECQERGVIIKGGKLLDELFANLLENTMTHADCENIKVSCDESEEEVIVRVEDDGKGLSDDIKDKLFEKGYKKGESAGSGLGLYLVKEIVESYGGSVSVKDSELGGARFDVVLRKA